jgi:hypothetical protein
MTNDKTPHRKLTSGEKHFLQLIVRGCAENEGWAKVSRVLRPLVADMPPELVELRCLDDGTGLVRLSDRGWQLVEAMQWL